MTTLGHQRHTEGRPCEDTEKMVVSEPRREASEETKPADILILDFQPPDLRDHNFLWFKWPSLLLCYFVTAALVNKYIPIEYIYSILCIYIL